MRHMTVLGASGFIGSHLAAELRRRGYQVSTPDREADLAGADLGTVFYCIGLTADFRTRPFDTVRAHVGVFQKVLEHSRFERLVYLSSTRLYRGADSATGEKQSIRVNPLDPSDLYNLSKAMGESLALHSGQPVRVVRLSNVYGPDWDSSNLIPDLIKAAIRDRKVVLQTSPRSAKDYVHLDDVIELLIRIAIEGRNSIYNVASGRNVTNAEVMHLLRDRTGCEVDVTHGAPTVVFPVINVDRVRSEFGFTPKSLVCELPWLVDMYEQHAQRCK